MWTGHIRGYLERDQEGHSGFKKEFGDCIIIIMEYLNREVKAWKWKDWDDLGWNKCRGRQRTGHRSG